MVSLPRVSLGFTSALLAAGLSLAPSATAHDTIIGATPLAGATVPTPPATLTLRFDNTVRPSGNQIVVKAPNGSVTTTVPTVSGRQLTAPFSGRGNGTYYVHWRITSADGHPVNGGYAFIVGTGAASAGSLAPKTPNSLAGPATPTTNEPGDNEPALIITGFAVGVAALVGGWFVARRRVRDDVA